MSDFVVSDKNAIPAIPKTPGETVLDYTLDWSKWLAADDDIAADGFDVIPQEGITQSSAGVTRRVADGVTPRFIGTTALLSGGVLDKSYRIRYRIRTVKGLIEDRCIDLAIRER